ncbi:MAG: helix-turn-helix domain-containing protein [Candidatus Methylacidiphilales bacterium]|nr:AraC family transcriptional regulator [Candidatus Methylacidiphilales bacterium]
MFLVYRNEGERRYGLEPIAPHPRWVWEYQFIVSGEHSVIVVENVTKEFRVRGPMVCISGPQCVHGWNGRPEDVCQAIIFHFDEVDFSIRSIVGNYGFRLLPISEEDVPLLYALYERCAEARRAIGTSPPEAKKRAGFFEPLIYSIVAAELTLLFLRHIPKAELGPAPNFGEGKVAEALAWYEANLTRSPTIDDVAHAVHISATHLRRLFHKIRGISPQEAFTEVQLKRVKWLMRDSAITLERIAESTGFGSASAFSRAFSKEFGVPPNTYRKTMSKPVEE